VVADKAPDHDRVDGVHVVHDRYDVLRAGVGTVEPCWPTIDDGLQAPRENCTDLGRDPHGVVGHDRLVHHAGHAQAHLLEAVITVSGPGRAPFEDGRAVTDQPADDQAIRAYAGTPGA
jgi:hypothetical protein